jgi:hypothetical protein
MYTLNEILTIIENQAAAHLQVKQYGQGDVWEINPKELDYLVLWAIEEGVVLNERTLTYNIRLLAMDRVLPGEENEQEVMSDTIQVLLDFVAYFRQLHTTDLSIQTSVSFEPFTERFDDKVSGHACVLSITQPYDYNKCQIPQTTNTIPPTVDGITLYDFCNQATLDRLTPVQIACLEAAFGLACDDATVQLNGTTVGTIPSGDSDSFTVNLDGSPSGVWDGTAWQVTSAPCDDATIELNGVEMTTIPSGDTENITVLQSSGATQVGSKQGTHWRIDDSAISINGSPVADVKAEDPLDIDVTQDGSPVGSWDGSAWIVPPCAAPSIAISYSNDTPTYGDTITITATVTGITPTFYTFIIAGNIDETITVQAGNTLSWVVNTLNPIIYVQATDGSSFAASVDGSLTVSSITEAGTFITALETQTSDTMGGRQKDAVNRLVWMLKGNDTTNSTDLWAAFSGTNNVMYVYCPTTDSTASFDGYKINLLDPTFFGTFVNMVAGDINEEGIAGGFGKYLNMNVQPTDFGAQDAMYHCYQPNYDRQSSHAFGVWQTTVSPAVVAVQANFWSATTINCRLNSANGGGNAPRRAFNGILTIGRNNTTRIIGADNGIISGDASDPYDGIFSLDVYAHASHVGSTGLPTQECPIRLAGFAVTQYLNDAEYLDFCEAWFEFNKIVIPQGRYAQTG